MNAVTREYFAEMLSRPGSRLTQHLNIWIGRKQLDLDVVDFKAKGGFCSDYSVDVTVTSPRLDIDGTATTTDCWGHTYYTIPAAQQFYQLPPGTDAHHKLHGIAFAPGQAGTNALPLVVETYFNMGSKYTNVWSVAADGSRTLLTSEPVEEKNYEYDLYHRATALYDTCPSDGYQLRDDKPFATASYAQLLEGSDALRAATLWSRDVTVGPGQTLKVSEPMDDAANYVGVAAFFRDTTNTEWSVLVPKAQWKKTDPVTLVAAERTLEIDSDAWKK